MNEPLARYCNWRVGGPADLFLIARTADELIQAVRAAQEQKQPHTVLGVGANVLVSDAGIRGLVILNRSHRIAFPSKDLVETDSGTNLAVLAKRAAQHGVSGLEFLVGIPGTVGAAVVGNAGTRTQWIGRIVERVLVLDREGTENWLTAPELSFSYRNSRLKQTGDVVVTARLLCKPDHPSNIERKMQDELSIRRSQPSGHSAGSVFMNPPNDFAGRLLEACGLKGFQIGGAKISERHANFILNTDDARARDIKAVIERAKSAVASRFGIQLKEEIRYLGEW